MGDVSIIDILKPYSNQPQGAIWDYMLYFMILIQFILLVLLFSGSLRDVIFIAVVMMASIADKLYLFGLVDPGAPPNPSMAQAVKYHTEQSIFTYGSRMLMVALPMLLITQTKISKAKPAAILLTIVSIAYFVGRWAFQQRVSRF